MAQRIDVVVFKGSTLIRLAGDRLERTLPGGYVGAVVNHRVRPVYRNRYRRLSVDLDDGGFAPDDCPPWDSQEPSRYIDDESETDEVAEPETDLEDNDYAYRSRNEAQRSGPEPLTTPRQESASVDSSSTLSLCRKLPFSLKLEAINMGVLSGGPPALILWLGEQVVKAKSAAESAKNDLEDMIDEATARAKKLQESCAEIRRKSALDKSRHKNSIKQLTIRIEALQRRLDDDDRGLANIAALEAENEALKSDIVFRKDVLEEWGRSEKRCADLQAELNNARERDKRLNSSKEMRRLVASTLKLFGQIDVHRSAVETIADEFFDPYPLLAILRSLDSKEPVRNKPIATHPGWSEVSKISTGKSDMGRLYFKYHEGRLFVVPHCKKDNAEQKRFFEKLDDLLSGKPTG